MDGGLVLPIRISCFEDQLRRKQELPTATKQRQGHEIAQVNFQERPSEETRRKLSTQDGVAVVHDYSAYRRDRARETHSFALTSGTRMIIHDRPRIGTRRVA
jgi:hypothetical protein